MISNISHEPEMNQFIKIEHESKAKNQKNIKENLYGTYLRLLASFPHMISIIACVHDARYDHNRTNLVRSLRSVCERSCHMLPIVVCSGKEGQIISRGYTII